MSEKRNLDAKTVLLGATMVGKTSIISRAVSNEFDQDSQATIGACYTAKSIDIGDAIINLQIWDTAGQERFRTLAPMYYRCAVIALLVFSVTDRDSLNEVNNWVTEMKAQTDEMPILFIVANKIDLEREIPTVEGQKVADELGGHYIEVSAKTGQGIDDLFIHIADAVSKKLTEGIPEEHETKTKMDITGKSEKSGKCKC